MAAVSMNLNGPLTWYSQHLNYSAAEAFCYARDGHLATVSSVRDNVLALELCGTADCWIGYALIDGAWEWMDGTPSNFTSFPRGLPPWRNEPTAGNQGVLGAFIQPSRVGWSWGHDKLSSQRPFVCRALNSTRSEHPTRAGNFTVHEMRLSYTAADEYCVALGGHLAFLGSWEESLAVHALTVPVGECWIGYNEDEVREAHGGPEYAWTDGHEVGFSERAWPYGGPPWSRHGRWQRWPGVTGRITYEVTASYMIRDEPGYWNDGAWEETRCFVCRHLGRSASWWLEYVPRFARAMHGGVLAIVLLLCAAGVIGTMACIYCICRRLRRMRLTREQRAPLTKAQSAGSSYDEHAL